MNVYAQQNMPPAFHVGSEAVKHIALLAPALDLASNVAPGYLGFDLLLVAEPFVGQGYGGEWCDTESFFSAWNCWA
jgi:hypothetical protein